MSNLQSRQVDLNCRFEVAPSDVALLNLLAARVPFRTLVQYGDRSLDALVAAGETKYRIVTLAANGACEFVDAIGPVAFIEAAFHAGLKPWPADEGEPAHPCFWNCMGPFNEGEFVEYVTEPAYDFTNECAKYKTAPTH